MADAKKPVLKIVRADGAVHFAPTSTKKKLNYQNGLLAPEKKYSITEVEMTDKEIADHPAYDRSAVVPKGDSKVALLNKLNASKDAEIEALKEQLASKDGKIIVPPNVTAGQLITLIGEAETPEEIDELIGDDTRVSVAKAAEKRKTELANPAKGEL